MYVLESKLNPGLFENDLDLFEGKFQHGLNIFYR